MASQQSWDTELREVGKGVYAYVQKLQGFAGAPPTSAGISNAGLIVGPESSIVIDTLNVPSHTRAFIKEISAANASPVRRVVITHHHADHTHGMDMFPESSFIAHANCRKELQSAGQEGIFTYAKSRPHWTDEIMKVKLVLPDTILTDRMTLYSGNREIQLIYPGPAHTDNDVMVFLPRERILFAGDIAFYKVGPLGMTADFENWVKVIDQILEMPVDVIVPGHGPVGAKEDLVEAQELLRVLIAEGKRCHAAGYGIEEAVDKVDLGRFTSWPDARERIAANFRAIYGKLN